MNIIIKNAAIISIKSQSFFLCVSCVLGGISKISLAPFFRHKYRINKNPSPGIAHQINPIV